MESWLTVVRHVAPRALLLAVGVLLLLAADAGLLGGRQAAVLLELLFELFLSNPPLPPQVPVSLWV